MQGPIDSGPPSLWRHGPLDQGPSPSGSRSGLVLLRVTTMADMTEYEFNSLPPVVRRKVCRRRRRRRRRRHRKEHGAELRADGRPISSSPA